MSRIDFSKGRASRTILLFSLPLIAQSLLQSLYNVVDSMIIGLFLGQDALSSVASSYSLMALLGSAMIGLSLGSGVVFSFYEGRQEKEKVRRSHLMSLYLLFSLALAVMLLSLAFLRQIVIFLKVPDELQRDLAGYLKPIFLAIPSLAVVYWASSILRSKGNSVAPFLTLSFSFLLNIFLDVLFIKTFERPVVGAAVATALSEYASAFILLFLLWRKGLLSLKRNELKPEMGILKEILSLSLLTSLQQSIMNLGILMVQALVNSYGAVLISAFSIGVKADGIAYLPLQEYGNGLGYFISENRGRKDDRRIREGVRSAIFFIFIYGLAASIIVNLLSSSIAYLFLKDPGQEVVELLSRYLLIEGSFYILIGFLFLLYGYFRSMNRPLVSLVLTIVSLGVRVAFSYLFHTTSLGYDAIFLSIPIGWFLADFLGFLLMWRKKKIY